MMSEQNKRDLEELIASVEIATGNPQGAIFSVSYWLQRIHKHPEEFRLDREYGLLWQGIQVWTYRSENGKYLIEKYKEYSAK